MTSDVCIFLKTVYNLRIEVRDTTRCLSYRLNRSTQIFIFLQLALSDSWSHKIYWIISFLILKRFFIMRAMFAFWRRLSRCQFEIIYVVDLFTMKSWRPWLEVAYFVHVQPEQKSLLYAITAIEPSRNADTNHLLLPKTICSVNL